MKRSEMIANVVKDSDGKYDKNTVNEVLFLLESYGMAPPIIKEQSWQMLPSGEMVYAVHEWERE